MFVFPFLTVADSPEIWSERKGQSIRNILCFPTKLEKEKTFQMHDSVVEASEGMRISKLQGLINLSK